MKTIAVTKVEKQMNQMKQFKELILQSLEHERGGLQVYEAAVNCATNPDLRERWQSFMSETQNHIDVLEQLCSSLGFDPEEETAGRQVVRHLGKALVEAMELATSKGDPVGAELVACECVVLAETKDHLNWTLIGTCAVGLEGVDQAALRAAYGEVEHEEDEHLYHTKGWCRELWIQSLGLNAVLPPPEELRMVTTAIGAAKAEGSAKALRLLG